MSEKFEFLQAYAPVFYEDKTYWVISGGRASGKTTNIGAYFVLKLMGDDYFRGVIARYTQRAITSSIYRDIVDIITDWKLTPYIEVKGDEIKNKLNGNMIITHSMKLQEGTMTARGKGLAKVSHLLIDEATELPSEEEYIKLIDTFRAKGIERRIFLLFNPTHKNHWIFRRFYLPDGSPNPKWNVDHGFIHTTYHDNEHNLDPKKIGEWERSKEQDIEYYEHHILGHWKEIGEGQVFTKWKFEWNPDMESEILYGLDFGWTDPTALVKVYKRGKTLHIEELIYESHLTTEDLAKRMVELEVPYRATIYADSANPNLIQTLRNLGFVNILGAKKGKDSIKEGIDKLNRYQVFANPNSVNLMNEYNMYTYRLGTDKPKDEYNHLMDAARYAMTGVQDAEQRYVVMGKPRQPNFRFQ